MILGALLALSFLLRIVGVEHGLPLVYEQDEMHAVEVALQHAAGVLNPPNFLHGDLTSYLLATAFGLYYAMNIVRGAWTGPSDVVRQYVQDPTSFYLIGRGMMACFGVLIVWMTFIAGKRLFGRAVGSMSALFIAVSVLHVNMSHLIKEDILASCVLMAAFLAAGEGLKRIETGRSGVGCQYLLLGIGIGVAMSAKYYAVVGWVWCLVLAAAEWRGGHAAVQMRAQQRGTHVLNTAGHLLLAALGTSVGFGLTSPYAVLEGGRLLHDLASLHQRFSINIIPNIDHLSSFQVYVFRYLPWSAGVAVVWASVVGTAWGLCRRERWRVLLVSVFPLGLLSLLSTRTAFPHYLTSAIPFVAMLAALPFDYLSAWRGLRMFAWLLGGVCAVSSSLASVRYDIYIHAPDTRLLAKDWIEQHVAPDERIAVDGASFETITFGPPLEANRETLEREIKNIQSRGGRGLLWRVKIEQAARTAHKRFTLCKTWELSLDQAEACAATFVVIATDQLDRSCSIITPNRDRRPALEAIGRRYELIKQFEPYPGIAFFPSMWTLRDQPQRLQLVGILSHSPPLICGPRIRIFRLRTS